MPSLVTWSHLRNERKGSGVVNAPDLERIALALANGTTEAATALYKLQTALNNYNDKKPIPRQLDSFSSFKSDFLAGLEALISFLQNCHGYADDYVTLCESSSTNLATQKSLLTVHLATVKQTCSEAGALMTGYDETYSKFNECRLKYLFQRRFSVPTGPLYPSRTTRGTTMDDSIPDFVKAARAAVRPNEAEALAASNAALQHIQESLKDLVAFWKDESYVLHSLVVALNSNSATISRESQRVAMEKWRHYQTVILGAMSSIAASADVTKVDAPQSSLKPQKGIWGMVRYPAEWKWTNLFGR
ncbi:hypothetical protein SERLA73DRAFT_190890 [Serpula lacrymans var. lacrymans S7.3]|uniref:Uncharacterized protein n=2 Tax=Serpula lacrymans var. lacrymans TaxID=341189 RepID=F8QGK6_SERL3|nr:uncharacterized protein SERLADRAFT_456867 [Serpula lacrymans var. lacrymans S7.9]EGN92552.1 hypothetical protein SERLA73DRAFT_190890 [Serpula lacrymans var. lacrymans S7.3]EGO29298.1 hypothetical protein SERLADRAFT_456867 [Serpula lacrymans var. lacrymans S7.9]